VSFLPVCIENLLNRVLLLADLRQSILLFVIITVWNWQHPELPGRPRNMLVRT
jgi:hypothetical protein